LDCGGVATNPQLSKQGVHIQGESLMNTEHIETPIQRILRENETRELSQNSKESLTIVANRLFHLEEIKNELGLKSVNKLNSYRVRKAQEKPVNKFQQTLAKINYFGEMARHCSAAAKVGA
jgi:hypothetical protein